MYASDPKTEEIKINQAELILDTEVTDMKKRTNVRERVGMRHRCLEHTVLRQLQC